MVREPTENVDVWPTLLDLLGLPPLEDVDGRSRLPEILAASRGEPAPARDGARFAHIDQTWGRRRQPPRPMVAVSEGPYRLVHRPGEGTSELYHRAADPLEQHDIGDEEPELRARLTSLAEEYLQRPPVPWQSAPEVELDDTELEQLRALGYAVE